MERRSPGIYVTYSNYRTFKKTPGVKPGPEHRTGSGTDRWRRHKKIKRRFIFQYEKSEPVRRIHGTVLRA